MPDITTIDQKSLDSYPSLKEEEIPLPLKLLVDSYEKRIAELLEIIKTLTEKKEISISNAGNSEPRIPQPVKGKFLTSSQLIAEMEKRTLKSRMG